MTAKDAVLESVGSHYVNLGSYGSEAGTADKEELYPLFTATWRGQPVRVEMRVDRYKHSSGWSDWRIYAGGAYNTDTSASSGQPGFRGDPVSDTARSRLGDLCKPLVEEWLNSPAYKASRAHAFQHAVRRELANDLRPSYGTDRAKRLLELNRSELPDGAYELFVEAITAYDNFAEVLRKID